jgi:hypothetical protein
MCLCAITTEIDAERRVVEYAYTVITAFLSKGSL